MGQLLAFGFTQLRRHPLLALITSGVPVTVMFAIVFSQAALRPELSPADLWHNMSGLQKFLTLSGIPLCTWIPFAVNQAVLAIAINAERDGAPLAPGRLAARALRPVLVLAIGFYFVSFLSLLMVPAIAIGLLLGFVPVLCAVEGSQKAIFSSTKLFGNHAGIVVGLWFLIPVVTVIVWALGLYGLLGNLPLPHRPIFAAAWFTLLTVISQTVLNGALINLYFDDRVAQRVSADRPVLTASTL